MALADDILKSTAAAEYEKDVVPFRRMLAPGRGSLLTSVTFPLTVICAFTGKNIPMARLDTLQHNRIDRFG